MSGKTPSRDISGGSQFSLRSLLAAFSTACLFFALLSWDSVLGVLAFCFVAGVVLIGWGIATDRSVMTQAGAILVVFTISFVAIERVGAFPLLAGATALSVVLGFANAPERPQETWLALTTLLACGVLGGLLYWDHFHGFSTYLHKDYFLLHLCAGLASGILITTPYVLIRIVVTKTMLR